MATFFDKLAEVSQNLQTNPDFEVARMRGRGLPEKFIMQQEQALRNQQAMKQQEQQFIDIVQAIGDRDPTRDELAVLYSLNPKATEMLAEQQQAIKPMSTIGKIQADIDAGLVDPETGGAAMKKATTSTPQFMMDPSGNIVAVDKQTGTIMPLGQGMGLPTSRETSPSMQSPITSSPSSVSQTRQATEPVRGVESQQGEDEYTAEYLNSALSQIPDELQSNPRAYQAAVETIVKEIPAAEVKKLGRRKMDEALAQLQDVLTVGANKGFITSESSPLTENIKNRVLSTEVGKNLSSFVGDERATYMQTLDSVRSSMLATIMQAYGLGATQMNTVKEMEMFMKQIASGTITKEAGQNILQLMRKREGLKPKITPQQAAEEARRRGLIQ